MEKKDFEKIRKMVRAEVRQALVDAEKARWETLIKIRDMMKDPEVKNLLKSIQQSADNSK